MPEAHILCADVLAGLQTLETASVHCVITSPPYWGLRDYGMAGQLGLEATPEEYVSKLVGIFREVKRVLRPDGTLWLNLGDSYAASQSTNGGYSEKSTLSGFSSINTKGRILNETGDRRKLVHGLKPKDLVGIPWRVAFALQADGWYLRSDIIWHKPNPMPESVRDRPTKAHEYVFLLSQRERYYYDQEAVREPHSLTSLQRYQYRPSSYATNYAHVNLHGRRPANGVDHNPNGRNRRSVWQIATQPYPEAHFATFPEKLVQPCLLAGTSAHGCCAQCGAPWKRVVKREKTIFRPSARQVLKRSQGLLTALHGTMLAPPSAVTIGWQITCPHTTDPEPCTVLDPFCGAGTVGVVALKQGRAFLGIELNPAYVRLAQARLAKTAPSWQLTTNLRRQ